MGGEKVAFLTINNHIYKNHVIEYSLIKQNERENEIILFENQNVKLEVNMTQ